MALDPRSPFSSNHPLAGKIAAGVRTTANSAKNVGASSHRSMEMQEMPVITLADRAQQMFSMDDKKGTRVYYARSGVFNTVDDKGMSINFVKGLYKTDNRSVMQFLQHFVEGNHIDYLELQEDPNDAGTGPQVPAEHERSPGSSSSLGEPNEPDQQEPEQREEPTPEADRSGAGGEGSVNPEQPVNRPTLRSQPGDRNDSPESGSTEQPKVKISALDLLRKGKS